MVLRFSPRVSLAPACFSSCGDAGAEPRQPDGAQPAAAEQRNAWVGSARQPAVAGKIGADCRECRYCDQHGGNAESELDLLGAEIHWGEFAKSEGVGRVIMSARTSW